MQKFLFLFSLFLIAGCEKNSTSTVENDPERPVYHRQEAFKKILRDFEPLGLMHRKEIKMNLIEYQKLAENLKKSQNEPWGYFKENTFYPPSRSKENIISENNIFLAEIEIYKNSVENLNLSAQKGDEKEMEFSYNALHNSCRSCHKKFRK